MQFSFTAVALLFSGLALTLPAQAAQCSQGLCVGDRVINIKRGYAEATVIDIESGGTYRLRFVTGKLAGLEGPNWGRADLAKASGCHDGHCVGDRAINLEKSLADVTVIGIEHNGRFVLRFDSGTLAGRSGHNWPASDLAKASGCHDGICTGVRYVNIKRDYAHVTVIALEPKGTYVVSFEDGSLAGKRGNTWPKQDLAVMSGCQDGLCVGQAVGNRENSRTAVIHALQAGGRYVLRFDDNGAIGGYWRKSDLIPRGEAPVRAPEPAPQPEPTQLPETEPAPPVDDSSRYDDEF